MVRRGEVDGRNLLEECVSFGGLAHACLIGIFFFFFLECGNGKGVELLEHNICTANAGIKYLDQRQEMTFAHFMMERQQQREDQIFVL